MSIEIATRKSMADTLSSHLVSDVYNKETSININWFSNVRVRDAVINKIYNDDTSVKNKYTNVLSNLQETIDQAHKDILQIMTVAFGISWSHGRSEASLDEMYDYIEAYAATHHVELPGLWKLMKRAYKSGAPVGVWESSIRFLSYEECLGIPKEEEEAMPVEETTETTPSVVIRNPDALASYVLTEYEQGRPFNTDYNLFILSAHDYTLLDTKMTNNGEELDKIVEDCLDGIEQVAMVVVTLNPDAELFEDIRLHDYLYIDLANKTYRSLICQNKNCCPKEGKTINA